MKTQGKVWIIYNSETKAQTKPMSVVQTQVLLLSLPEEEHSKFFLWTPGWDKWASVEEFLESEQKYFVMSQPPKPKISSTLKDETLTKTKTKTRTSVDTQTNSDSPYTHVLVGDTPIKDEEIGGYHCQDFNGDELDLSKIKKFKTEKKPISTETETDSGDRRRDSRHNFKIEVVLLSKLRSFRTHSKNISLSGTLLENAIPKDFLNRPFDLIIVNPFETDPAKARLHFRAKIVGDLQNPRRLMFIEQDVSMTVRLDALLKAYVAYQEQVRKSAG